MRHNQLWGQNKATDEFELGEIKEGTFEKTYVHGLDDTCVAV